jgi:hypothetical protein
MRKVVILSFAGGLLAILGALRVGDLWTSRTETTDRMRSRVASDALVLAEHVAGVFTAGDQALRQLALHSRQVGGPLAPKDDWAPSLESAGAGLQGIGAITILDDALVIRHANRPVLLNQSRRDDPVFDKALKTATSDTLIIGAPFKSPIADRYLSRSAGRSFAAGAPKGS